MAKKKLGPRALFNRIRFGSRVTINVYAGMGRGGPEYKPKTGRAVMRGPAGWVLNMGGPHGTPDIASEANIVAVGDHPVTRSKDTDDDE